MITFFLWWYFCGLIGFLLGFVDEYRIKKEFVFTVGDLLLVLIGSFLGVLVVIFQFSKLKCIDWVIFRIGKKN